MNSIIDCGTHEIGGANMNKSERILGGLFGVACGDALGGTLEFTSENIGKKKYGYHKEIIGGGEMNLKPGEITDDTVMTMAVAEGILENSEAPIDAIGRRFVKWYNSNPPDIGMTCQDAIEEFIKCGDWMEAGLRVKIYSNGMNAGNGSLMRCLPVALYYKNFDKMVEITKAQSDMTHYNVRASDACIIYNTIIYKLLSRNDKFKTVKDILKDHKEYEKVFFMKKEELNPSGYVVDSLQCALWCFINNDNVEDIICEAVNLYGDSDTIGAIAGGLAGVYYGYSRIPERWKEKILVKDELKNIAEMINGKKDVDQMMNEFIEYLRSLGTLSENSIKDDMSRINSMAIRGIDFKKGEEYAKRELEKSSLSESTIKSCLRLCRRYSDYLESR